MKQPLPGKSRAGAVVYLWCHCEAHSAVAISEWLKVNCPEGARETALGCAPAEICVGVTTGRPKQPPLCKGRWQKSLIFGGGIVSKIEPTQLAGTITNI